MKLIFSFITVVLLSCFCEDGLVTGTAILYNTYQPPPTTRKPVPPTYATPQATQPPRVFIFKWSLKLLLLFCRSMCRCPLPVDLLCQQLTSHTKSRNLLCTLSSTRSNRTSQVGIIIIIFIRRKERQRQQEQGKEEQERKW